jgi:hypothetical protein
MFSVLPTPASPKMRPNRREQALNTRQTLYYKRKNLGSMRRIRQQFTLPRFLKMRALFRGFVLETGVCWIPPYIQAGRFALCGKRRRHIFGQATRIRQIMANPLNTGFLPVVFVRDECGIFIPHEGPGILYHPICVGFKKFRVNFIETAAFFSGEDACRLFDLQQNNKRNIIIAKKVRIGYIFHVFFSLSTSTDNAFSE